MQAYIEEHKKLWKTISVGFENHPANHQSSVDLSKLNSPSICVIFNDEGQTNYLSTQREIYHAEVKMFYTSYEVELMKSAKVIGSFMLHGHDVTMVEERMGQNIGVPAQGLHVGEFIMFDEIYHISKEDIFLGLVGDHWTQTQLAVNWKQKSSHQVPYLPDFLRAFLHVINLMNVPT